ncbi:hypothetical protein A2W45_00050 [Candidatus Curtissbacteria bacterium RIFCSPHIGHO2_12_41_11]|uniref:Phosphatidic acid phosphatase type 2/haloperoxidase domain-containing protein n=1 Tax=Candidatus Curtissbacteria bacterium RIFCSPHIGHO2_12_41_11 TaxID=1797718 RepID=A0A1F5H5F2_9BACT|nr:MAG: hypothetical protein A2W45_00050 [Candidatus Curtissbacteria bacterium RIFCSPHIGHO2_12_41_11]
MKKSPFWGVFLLAAFLVLSVFVYLELNSFDQSVTSFLQASIPRRLDIFFSIFSIIGVFEISTIVLLLIVLYFKKLNKLIILGGYGAVLAVEMLSKSAIAQIAPSIELLRTKIFFSFPTGEVSSAFYAYPSGHVSRTAFISIILLLIIWNSSLKREQKIALGVLVIVFLAVMTLSRIYLAEHWASDGIGGILLGSAVGLLAFNFKKG